MFWTEGRKLVGSSTKMYKVKFIEIQEITSVKRENELPINLIENLFCHLAFRKKFGRVWYFHIFDREIFDLEIIKYFVA